MGVGMPFGFAIFDQSIAGRVDVSLCFFGTDREPDRERDGGGWLCTVLRRYLAVTSASPGNVDKKGAAGLWGREGQGLQDQLVTVEHASAPRVFHE